MRASDVHSRTILLFTASELLYKLDSDPINVHPPPALGSLYYINDFLSRARFTVSSQAFHDLTTCRALRCPPIRLKCLTTAPHIKIARRANQDMIQPRSALARSAGHKRSRSHPKHACLKCLCHLDRPAPSVTERKKEMRPRRGLLVTSG